jgi:outer membrane protein OmpA-like peptidoglycan-associated protein
LEKAMNNQGDVFYFLDELMFKKLNGSSDCPDYDTIKKLVYAQNLRHTDDVLVFPAVPAPPPIWLTDSITLPSVLFETNQSVIRAGYSAELDSLVTQWKEKSILQLQISGHTDAVGRPADNRLLSQNRADAVKNYFMQRLPALSNNIMAVGYGADQPVADNHTTAGRTRNRRVVIRITYAQPVKKKLW